MLTRRTLLATTAAFTVVAFAFGTPTWAQSTDPAGAFVRQTAGALTGIVNGPGSLADKQKGLQEIIDRAVDVDAVGRFCLGRFWNIATPAQQQEYLMLFHRVLMINITSKVADYKGVSFTMGRSAPREGDTTVSTTVSRPDNAPTRVDWIVSSSTGSPKIIDVVAEGTSLRLTQRSDYASYLSHNGNSVPALIAALRQQSIQPPG